MVPCVPSGEQPAFVKHRAALAWAQELGHARVAVRGVPELVPASSYLCSAARQDATARVQPAAARRAEVLVFILRPEVGLGATSCLRVRSPLVRRP